MSRSQTALAAGLLALLCAGPVRADGGVVVAAGAAGPYEITVLVAPARLRAGPSEWSVLVQAPGTGEVVLDARVEIVLRRADAPADLHAHAGTSGGVEAQRSASSNRLLHSARLELASPGAWQARVFVRGRAGEGSLAFEVPVAEAAPALAQHWRAVAVAPLGIALFALHQGLALRRRR